MDELTLMPLELTARIAALVPPPRTHRHRYLGVLAPHSPLRAAVTAEMLLSASESLVCHKIPATNLLQTGQSCSGRGRTSTRMVKNINLSQFPEKHRRFDCPANDKKPIG